MKKTLFSTLGKPVLGGFAATLTVIALVAPAVSLAQPYYGNYSYNAYPSCLALTNYEGLGSTDGQTNGQVSELQIFLNQAGYLSGVSGTYDNGTLGAVINFQRAYGLVVTGTLNPQTISLINQQSCASGINGYGVSYPVTNYSSGSNCYWTGTVYNSTYVCSNAGVIAQPYVAPNQYIAPTPAVCNWNNGYYNGSYGNYCNGYGVNIRAISASYDYNTVTLTVSGYGFSASGNTVYFGNSVVSNAVSNGSTLTFTVPAGYNWGTYGVHITNAQGQTSNTLSFTLGNANGYGWNGNYDYNNGYNNGYYNGQPYIAPTLSSISGPSNVAVGQTNTWTISTYGNSSNYYNYPSVLTTNWGDGTVTNSQNSYGSNQTYTFTHAYMTPGTYTVRITITTNGATSYQTYTVFVSGNNTNYWYNNQPYTYWNSWH